MPSLPGIYGAGGQPRGSSQGGGQVEDREQVRVGEAGDGGDPFVSDGQDHDPVAAAVAGSVVGQVCRESGVAIGPGDDQPDEVESSVGGHGGEEPGDGVGADDPDRL